MADLVLSKYRDPWTSWGETHLQKAKWVADYFQKMGREIHERGFHYWLVSLGDVVKPDGTPYSNTEKDWNSVQDWIRWAKYLQIGDWSKLIDRKHPEPVDYTEAIEQPPGTLYKPLDSPKNLVDARLKGLVDSIIEEIVFSAPRYESQGYQNYFLVVFCEKNTMNNYINPIMEEFRGIFQPLVGESSVERVESIVRRAVEKKKPVRIFYISDFDPSGDQMPISVARKAEWFCRAKYQFSCDIKLKSIALTYDQVTKFRLPGVPTKEGDSRAKAFIGRFGDRATELDALEALYPGELAKIVREALAPYKDDLNPRAVLEENDRITRLVRQMTEEMRPRLEAALSGLKVEGLETLDLEKAINTAFQPPAPDHNVDDSANGWLLDTSLSYEQQLQLYLRWKQGAGRNTPPSQA